MPASLFQSDAQSPARFVRVAVDRALDAPDGLLYADPDAALTVGCRVVVPLGRGDREAPGVVVESGLGPDALGALEPGRVKPVLRAERAALPPTLVELARWIARYYCCPLGPTLASMLPAAVKRGVGERTRSMLAPVQASPLRKLPPATRRAWEAIGELPEAVFPLEAKALAARIGASSAAPINRLEALGLLQRVERRVVRARVDEMGSASVAAPELNDEQRRTVDAIGASLGSFAPHLIQGVTGSGKTEVYLRVIRAALDRGAGAIVLVPEISLTPQTLARFQARLAPEGVAVLHSGLTQAQRNREWTRLLEGEARVVIGARSAIFAPLNVPIGVIVVDEEHDGAYKQDQAPRYHARDVAIKRAQLEACPVVLGSATPSLESWVNTRPESGARSTLHVLPRRATGAPMPHVRILDLADELRALRSGPDPDRSVRLIGPTLLDALDRALASGGRAVLLLNRRGYASYIACPDQTCGWLMRCDHCDATLVYHRADDLPLGGVVRCHHCLAEQKLPSRCPTCEKRITTFGMGTQRVEEELLRLLPHRLETDQLQRLDADAVHGARQWHEALDRFARGGTRVMLGTQMVAKGHDFPNVRLVGVVNADTALHLPDFRAAERTFQLVSQVAGRAGRAAGERGEVIVQTFSPHAPAIVCAARHDYDAFANRELALRQAAGLPPAGRMARIVLRDEDLARAQRDATRVATALRDLGLPSLRVRGPAPCPISRIADRHRIAVDLLAPGAGDIQRALAALRSAGLVTSDAHTAVDVDPIALL